MRDLQEEIIAYEHILPEIDPEEEIKRSVDFLKDCLKTHPFLKSLVLGISGGQDSTLTGKLCQIAIDELRAETGDRKHKFIVIRLLYDTQGDAGGAADAVAFQKPDVDLTVNIRGAVNKAVESLERVGVRATDFSKGDIKARQRTIVQYDTVGVYSGVVVGTDHAAENMTGLYTRYGDGASDLVPLFKPNKHQSKALFEYLGCPEHLYLKAPTADLEEDAPDLPDEVALSVIYKGIDNCLEGKEVKLEAAEEVEVWRNKTKHKRELPITVFGDFYKR